MKIKMLADENTSEGRYQMGDEIDAPDSLAAHLLERNLAVAVEELEDVEVEDEEDVEEDAIEDEKPVKKIVKKTVKKTVKQPRRK